MDCGLIFFPFNFTSHQSAHNGNEVSIENLSGKSNNTKQLKDAYQSMLKCTLPYCEFSEFLVMHFPPLPASNRPKSKPLKQFPSEDCAGLRNIPNARSVSTQTEGCTSPKGHVIYQLTPSYKDFQMCQVPMAACKWRHG